MKFSLTKFMWRCVLGGEIIYAACLGYGYLLDEKGAELHRALFALMPGFQWGSAASVLMGAVYVLITCAIGAAYVVWMLNSSVEK